jgi:hypothetical protein
LEIGSWGGGGDGNDCPEPPECDDSHHYSNYSYGGSDYDNDCRSSAWDPTVTPPTPS